MQERPTIFLVDDDSGQLDWTASWLRGQDFVVETFSSAEQFLERADRSRIGCLVTDLRMPGLSGIELIERLRQEKTSLPVVLLTAFGDIPTAVQAMRAGAMTFLEKPFNEHELLRAISEAVQRHRGTWDTDQRRVELASCFAQLTDDEVKVLDRMISGKPNKVIASELQIGLRTVELRRSNVMRKIRAESLAELVCKFVEYRSLQGGSTGPVANSC
jgi:two-component system, LuxR family, response regulator FixJ